MRADVCLRLHEVRRAAQAADHLFEVVRVVDGEREIHAVGSHELTAEEVARFSTADRAIYLSEEERWARVDEECERIEREAEDIAGADDPAEWRDGEAAVHNGEAQPETEAECLAAE